MYVATEVPSSQEMYYRNNEAIDLFLARNGKERDFIEAVNIWKELSNYKYPDACAWLSICLKNGYGVLQDEQEAEKFMIIAAECGNNFALARCYASGSGVLKNAVKAVDHYKKAIDENEDPRSQANLGYCYFSGEGLADKDYQLAFKYNKDSADVGYPAGQFNLGYFYENGVAVEKDIGLALLYYRLAADQGYVLAFANLGVIYENGVMGVEKNLELATKYYKLGADKGHIVSIYNLARCYFAGFGIEKK